MKSVAVRKAAEEPIVGAANDDKVPQKNTNKPKTFTLEWWLGIMTAYMLWKYTARDWAVSTVSSINTTAQFTVGGYVLSWVSTTFPEVCQFFHSGKVLVTSIFLATWDMVMDTLL